MRTEWSDQDIAKLRQLASSNTLFLSEIAEQLGKPVIATRHIARRLGIKSEPQGRKGKWNSKHSHLRERVLRYFLNHTWKQTMEEFGLKESELKSLFTVAYRDPSLAHLRKDKRRKDAWTLDETLYAIRHAGILPRELIAKNLNRGGVHSVKEAISRLSANTRYLNGVTATMYREIFGGLPAWCLKTIAGPTAPGVDCHYVLVPWTECEKALTSKIDPTIRKCIRAMARFQRWIHGIESDAGIKRRLRYSLGKGIRKKK